MIANNIFRAFGEFCTEVLFIPYDFFRSLDGWWITNSVNVVLIGIGFGLFFYWLSQLQKFRKAGTE